MDIELKQKKYRIPRKYWPWIGGGVVLVAVLVWLALGNFTSTLQVDNRGLSIATVEDKQFDRIHAKYPKLEMMLCSGGGARCDYETLPAATR